MTDAIISEKSLDALKNARSIAVLTGAGISAESGVPTFRDPDGLWAKFKPEELANFDAFWSNTRLVSEWYQHRRDLIDSVDPNPGHYALADLEGVVSEFTLITQNVDGLHQSAGSQNVLELHGTIMTNRCCECDKQVDGVRIEKDKDLPVCSSCGGKIRPNVVWFGEMLPTGVFEAACDAAGSCDVFLSIGTSSVVYPAASLPLVAKENGAYVIEVNRERTEISSALDETLLGPSGEILPEVLRLMGS